MNSAVKCLFAFSLGAAAGSLVASRVLKAKYERITQEEIDAYKAYVKARDGEQKETSNTPTDDGTDDSDAEIEIVTDIIAQYKSDDDRKEDGRKLRRAYNIHVISPDEYDEFQDYEKKSLTYYADGVIADEWDNVLKNADELIGENIGDHFGEFDEDSVFVRNDDLKCDFEILRDIQTYSDAMGLSDHPYDVED